MSSGVESAGHSIEIHQRQLNRILDSNTFRNAQTLRQLLQFLGDRTLNGNSDCLKEYTIGLEVFSRKPDFDPKTDTIVRVQIHRLRQKLKEYYQTEGANDPIRVEIPKGHYQPVFGPLATYSSNGSGRDDPQVAVETVSAIRIGPGTYGEPGIKAGKPWGVPRPLIYLFISLLAAAFGYWLGSSHPKNAAGPVSGANGEAASIGAVDNPARSFWAKFIGNDHAPIIAYPDAVFLLDDSNDLFRYRYGASDARGTPVNPHLAEQYASNPALVSKAGNLYYENGYTGTGDLEGLATLSELFAEMGVKATIKSSRNITPDDLRQHDVILLGSSFQNIAVAQFLTTGDFSFKNPDVPVEEWRGEIVDSHPGPGEQATYHTERNPVTQALETDYGLVSIQPGLAPGRLIAIIGGLDTTGTAGTASLVASVSGIEQILKSPALSGRPHSLNGVPFFQAIVRVHLENGYEVLGSDLVSVHPLKITKSNSGNQTTNANLSRQAFRPF